MSIAEQAQQVIPEGTWNVDAVHSSVEFGVLYNGVATMRGAFTDIDATIEVSDGAAVISGAARVASVNTKDENLTGHLQSPDFFDAERFPELTFRSTEIVATEGTFSVPGEITIKGVTKPIALAGTFGGVGQDAYGLDRIGLELEGEIDRTEFGILWNADLPSGGKALADTVTLEAHISAVKA